MPETTPEELYIRKLRNWLLTGNRYVQSFPDERQIIVGKIARSKLPHPNTDPIGAYKNLTERLRDPTPENISVNGIMSTIDLSCLDPGWTTDKLREEYETAKKFGVASVCVYGSRVAEAVKVLKNTGIAVAAAIAFDKGQATLEQKVQQAKDALDAGATEIDMPINLGRLIGEEDNYVFNELMAVWKVCHERGAIFKPIANVDRLDAEWKQRDSANYKEGGDNPYIIKYCELVKKLQKQLPGGYHQIMFKTSTGFDHQSAGCPENKDHKDYRGALVPGALRIFREQSEGTNIGIKAAGKVRSAQEFIDNMRKWGVVRYGCTTTPKIANELEVLKYRSHYDLKA